MINQRTWRRRGGAAPKRSRTLRVGLALSTVLSAGLSAGLGAQKPQKDTPPVGPVRYANTPKDLLPFGRGVRPFHWFYQTPQAYLGPRAVAPEAKVATSYRIGLLISAPGTPDGTRGLMVRHGVELAFAEANARLDPGEPRREIIRKEAAPLWGSAATGMARLCIDDNVLAVLGSVDGTATHVALRVALKTGVFIVNTATSDPTLTETAVPWLLRTFPDDRQHAYRLARVVVKQRGRKRIAVLRANDRYGRTGIREFIDSVRRLGRPVLVEMRYEPGNRDFATQIARIRAARADAVVFWGDGEDLGYAARALRVGGVEALFFGPDRLVTPDFLTAAGTAAEGTTATFPYDPTRQDSAWTGFMARFKKRFGKPPDHFAAYSYDGARILLEALAKSGPDRVRLRDALAAVRHFDGVTGRLVFDPTHNNLCPVHLAQVVHGKFEFE